MDARNGSSDSDSIVLKKNHKDVQSPSTSSKFQQSVTPRRGTRQRTKPNKYGEFSEYTPTKQRFENETSSDDGESYFKSNTPKKSSALFESDDIDGQDMFKFKSRHSRLGLQNKVMTALQNSPRTKESSPLKTPKKTRHSNILYSIQEGTPKHVHKLMKKRILHEVDSDSSYTDFSASSSDFIPEESDKSEDSSASNDDTEEEKESPKKSIRRHPQTRKDTKVPLKQASDYILAPDNYFMMNSSKKITTSDHILERLKNLNVDDGTHHEIESFVSDEHKNKIQELQQSYESLFDNWCFALSNNFNVVLYGVGSKRTVLQKFQAEKLNNMPCIVVNGFFPSLTIKNILETIIIDLLQCNHVPNNIKDVVCLIDNELLDRGIDLFLIIHNIDGTMLRNAKSQSMLANISQIKNVHTIASIDHINAPLVWDHSKLSKFNFTWWDVTTFMPYLEETSYENSIMSQRNGGLQLSSLRSVYQSLTANSKGIFNIIIQNQLEKQKQSHYQGFPFKELYAKSREQFLVSSDVALRAQLTEFLDHKLVKMKRTVDGSENLIIPIEKVLLQQFLDSQGN